MHALIQVISTQLDFEGDSLLIASVRLIKGVLDLTKIIMLWSILKGENGPSLIFGYKSLKVGDTCAQVVLNQLVVCRINLMVSILISNITRISNVLIQAMLCPLIKRRRLIFCMLAISFRTSIKLDEPLLMCKAMHASISSMKDLSVSLIFKFDG